MNHRKVVDEIVQSCFCARKDLPDLVIHELRHLGLNTNDYQKCEEELKKVITEG